MSAEWIIIPSCQFLCIIFHIFTFWNIQHFFYQSLPSLHWSVRPSSSLSFIIAGTLAFTTPDTDKAPPLLNNVAFYWSLIYLRIWWPTFMFGIKFAFSSQPAKFILNFVEATTQMVSCYINIKLFWVWTRADKRPWEGCRVDEFHSCKVTSSCFIGIRPPVLSC